MAIFSRIILTNNLGRLKTKINLFGIIRSNKLHTNEVPVKEVQIPTQWGHIAAKLWGTNEDRPILAVHGWQDNAGTWDPLIPLLLEKLNNKRSVLAIDLPGNGLSSWIPPGGHYYAWDYPRLFFYLKEYFKWGKLSILSHSLGSIAGFRFACVFPEEVDFFIAFDSLIYDDIDSNSLLDRYPEIIRKCQISQSSLQREPPCYTWDEIVKVWHLGTSKSVALESCHHLLKRGAKQSKQDPDKYYFSRDPRHKYTLFTPEDKKFVEALAMRLKCPTLYIKAIDSPYAFDGFSVSMRELLEKNCNNFECHFVPGTHHVHLNNPELVLPYIMKFLQRHSFA